MEKFIRKISTAFIKKLPEQKTFYTSKDFTEAGFPPFLTGRLKAEIEKEVLESVALPETEWINTDAPAVQAAWQAFAETLKSEVRLPEHASDKIITKAVENCLKMAIQPKRSIPALLFIGDDELDYPELKKRAAAITINGHLAYGLVRYMEKKQKDSIYIENARTVIEKIDQKLVSDYNPLNWLDVLKPVFELAGPSVDSDLLRMFFEDKGLHRAAKKFDLLDDTVDETGFIEVMSSAELLDFEGYDDDQQTLFEESTAGKKEDQQKEFEEDDEDLNLRPEAEEEVISEEEDSDDLNSLYGLDVEDEEDEELAGEAIKAEEQLIETVEEADETVEIDEEDLNSFFITEEDEDETEEPPFDLDEEEDLPEEKEPEAQIKPEEEIDEKTEETEEKTVTDEPDEIFSEDVEDDKKDEDESDEEVPLLNRFTFDDSFFEEDDEVEEDEDSRATIYSELNLVKEDREQVTLQSLFDQVDEAEEEEEENKVIDLFSQDESEDEEETNESEIQSDLESKLPADEEESDSLFLYNDFTEEEEPDEVIPESISDQSVEDDGEVEDDDGEVPMWRSFLERDDVEEEAAFQFEDEDDEEAAETGEDGFIEEPIYDLTTEEPETDEKIGQISQWLEDEQDRFIENLFGNSEAAYEQALAEIVDFDDWRKASKFIEKEIFSRNRIDVYDEIAVDFTDRLHTYFMEYKS
jgi:hypothetical protein